MYVTRGASLGRDTTKHEIGGYRIEVCYMRRFKTYICTTISSGLSFSVCIVGTQRDI